MWMNHWWEWITLPVRSLTVTEGNIVVTVLAKLVLLFSNVLALFFLMHSLIDRCQIVTDTCKNNVSKFVWKPFKSPLLLWKWKRFGEASLFNLHHLYFNYHLLAQKLFSLWRILPYLQQPVIISVLSERISSSLKKLNILLIIIYNIIVIYYIIHYIYIFQDLGHSFSP